MATYVNDLRLKEIGTGESSGTWGSETNTNLELIGEALGFGTEAITTNADTHTTTVADGSTDPGRAMYIKYTGTLDSACTITIAPNTMSRMHFIENGTSGSQNIIISQGTGANVTIPPGDTKAVYLDGAGSGAAVVDAFASLNVVDLKVEDDLTVTDDLIVNGDIDLEGSIDVNGTANLDVVDIDGALTQDGGAVFNEDSADVDFRVESNGNANMLFVDGGNDRVGIGTASPSTNLDVTGDSNSDDNMFELTNSKYDSTDSSGETGILFGWNNHVAARIAAYKETVNRTGFKIIGEAGFNVPATIATFKSTGDVGIGTDSPSTQLHVQDTGVSGLTLERNVSGAGASTTLQPIIFGGPDSASADANHSYAKIDALTSTITNGSEDGNLRFFTSDSGSLDEAMRIDSSGNVGIGKTSPAAELDVFASSTPAVRVADGSGFNIRLEAFGSNTAGLVCAGGATNMTFQTNETERVRIAANGDLGWSATSAVHDSGAGTIGAFFSQSLYGFAGGTATNTDGLVEFNKTNSVATNNNVLVFSLDGSFQGDIDFNGGVVRYNTTSDYRRKENVTPLENATNQLKQLKTYNFNFIDNPDFTHQGFLAHEAQEVVPNAVSGSKDAVDSDGNPVYQTMDNSVLVPLLVKTIQELEARITTLEGE